MTTPSRSNNQSLPDHSELSLILEREASRPVPASKQDVHYPRFETISTLIEAAGIMSNLFAASDQSIYDVVAGGKQLLDDLVPKLLEPKLQFAHASLFDDVYDYLAETDEPEPADLIMLFGARTLLRAEKATALYDRKLAPTIIVSGGNPVYAAAGNTTEAATYRAYLIKRGVPTTAIITEDQAITIPDNVRRSLNVLDELKMSPQRIILVNSPYSQRRGWAIMKKHVEDNVTLIRVNANTVESYQRDKWYLDEGVMRVFLNEFIKMRASVVYNTA